MADIELVIKIPEEVYKSSKRECKENDSLIIDTFTYAIGTGTPLPKGHGRLIDGDELESRMKIGYRIVKDAKTIVEADKEYEAKVITRGNCMMCGKELTEGLFFCKECGDKANKADKESEENGR